MKKTAWIFALVLLLCLAAAPAPASDVQLSDGQKVYVPVYSHIYYGQQGATFDLAVTLSIRNTSMDHGITIQSAAYYDSAGKLLKQYAPKPLKLGTLATHRFLIGERDKGGGSGANFVVHWTAERAVSHPVIQSVMIGTRSNQGISFVCDGVGISD